ncbi:hypothetical protein [Cellulomonas sp. NPDC089187]|uniref:hypothetical protein n=1 Tax=Cellulomonas sp. NPDC089187 TaxID=3154970 RepID=UPI00341B9A6A
MTAVHVGHRTVADVRPRARVLPEASRIWAALSGLGYGLVTIGIGAGHLAHYLPVGIGLLLVGFTGLGWAVLALRGTIPSARPALLALVVTAPLVLLSARFTGTLPTAAEASALTLGLLTAVLIGLHLRTDPVDQAPPAGQQALAMFAGAMLVATITVPGLAATDAGAHAVPHGSHGLPAEQHHH